MAQQQYHTLSNAFGQYSEALELWSTDAEGGRRRVQQLEEQWHASGLTGHHIPEILRTFRRDIAWERMVPDMFNKFYRFTFHLCKQHPRKHISVDLALEVWQLLLPGRFRLLDRWCDFITQRQPVLRVINEDQWRQVLDFSRSVHEDLSNYDPNGAWACFLDDFVDHLRLARPGSRQLMEEDMGFAVGSCLAAEDLGSMSMLLGGMPMSPRPGSKRRSPDVDVVVERLSAIPLPSSQSDSLQGCDMGPMAASPQGPITWPPGPQVAPAISDSSSAPPAPTSSGGAGGVVSSSGRAAGPSPKRHCGEAARQALGAGAAAGASVVGSTLLPGVALSPQQQPMAGPLEALPAGGAPPMAPAPSHSFTFELPMVQVSGRRHIRSRRSNVSELVSNTVSEALFQ